MLTVGIVDSHGQVVRHLVTEQALQARPAPLHLERPGRTRRGRARRAATGRASGSTARPRRSCCRTRSGWTPSPPRIRVGLGEAASDLAGPRRPLGRDARALPDQRTRARLALVGGKLEVRTLFQRLQDRLDWYGRVAGKALPPGKYRLSLAAVDLAGNESQRVPAGLVKIRYVSLPAGGLHSTPGALVSVPVSTDAKKVQYALRRGSSTVAVGDGPPRRPLPGAGEAGPLRARGRGRRATAPRTTWWSRRVSAPPLLVLGVRRSGTTLLRVDARPPLGARRPRRVVLHPAARRPAPRRDRRRRVRRRPAPAPDAARVGRAGRRGARAPAAGDAARARRSRAVYETYAARHGKSRWGDKTPMYMQHLAAARAAVPGRAVRPSRSATAATRRCRSSRCRRGSSRSTWAHPRDGARTSPASGAPRWSRRGSSARASGRPLPRGALRGARRRARAASCARSASSRASRSSPAMLDYAGEVDVSAKPHQQSLTQPPTAGLRDWRTEIGRRTSPRSRTVAGDLLARARLRGPPSAPDARGGAPRTWYRRCASPRGTALAPLCGGRPPGGGGTRRFRDLRAPLGCSGRGTQRGSRSARSSSAGRSRSRASTCPCRSARRSVRRRRAARTSSARASRRRRARRRRRAGPRIRPPT